MFLRQQNTSQKSLSAFFKGKVHLKIQILPLFIHLQVILKLYDFIS